jgi:hypothetical protein
MKRAIQELLAAGELRGMLVKDVALRMVEVSVSGGLLESTTPLEVGTAGLLQVAAAGREHDDHVRVVRCAAIEGAGSLHRVAVEFLWIRRAADGTLRALARNVQRRHQTHAGRVSSEN